jgi:FAD/FMN-containing dehydrogenase
VQRADGGRARDRGRRARSRRRRPRAELFWALRGGGGNFGAVTALEFRLHPIERVYAGSLIWDWQDAQRVLHRWADWTLTLPESVMSVAHVRQLPDLDVIPEPVRGRDIVIVQAVYVGDEETGRDILRPLRELAPEMDTVEVVPPVASCGWPATPRAPRRASSTGRSCTPCRRTPSTPSAR